MDAGGEKRGRSIKRSGEVDWISNLPDCLLFEVLLNIPTKDVVKTSALSSRWRNLWKYVPALDLWNLDFPEYKTFLSFVDSFLDLNSDSCLQKFELKYDADGEHEPEIDLISRWVNTLVKRKVKHIDLLDELCMTLEFKMPPTVYTCESLVSLKLDGLNLPSPDLVSLPCLKVIYLTIPQFDDDLAFETLISRCPVLQTLFFERSLSDDTQVLRVRSQSLLNFTHVADSSEELVEELVIAIDAPRLEYLRLSDDRTATFILNNPDSLVKADIDTVFNLGFKKKLEPNDLQKRNMIRNFLDSISGIKDMFISSTTLEVIYAYSRCEPLPLFRKLSKLRVEFSDYSWEMLPILLESCPNVKSLVVGPTRYLHRERINILSGPRCFLASLEYVKIERPLKGEAMEMKLVSYLLENSTSLKKLTLYIDDSRKKEESAIFKGLLNIPRLSSSFQVVVL